MIKNGEEKGENKMSDNKFTQSIDVLDMLINILSEHEKNLDELINRLEVIADRFDTQNQAPRKHPPKENVHEAEMLRQFYEPL